MCVVELRFRDSLTSRGVSAFTVSGYLVAVRQFFASAEGIRAYPNVARGVKGTKRVKGFRRDCLTVTHVRELLAGNPRDTVEGKRNLALLNLMIRTGLVSGRLSPHSLRHTAVTLALQAGASLQETQAMARHQSITTTMIYAHTLHRLAQAPERKIYSLLAGTGA